MSSSAPVHAVPNMFAPVSPPAESILELSWLVFAISGAIFFTVAGILLYCVVRYRARPEDDREPAQIYGSNQIELAWTLVPTLIVLVLFLATARTINELDLRKPLPGSLGVTIVGHQWWWEIRYPELRITTANELHVPVSGESAARPTFLTLESVDVIHSFWVPQLAGKMDVVPNRTNYLWFAPTTTGTFLGQCAEYCGTQHAHMLLRVVVHTPEDFDAWVASQKRPEVVEASVAEGRKIFEATACINCHTLGGTEARGTFGPDLTHLMSRETIGAGVAANTFENLRSWVLDPAQLKPGVLMPAMKLSDDEIDKLTRFLVSLK